MGNTESAKKKQETMKASQQRGKPSEGKLLIKTKNILLLHSSNSAQLQVVRNFRYALTAKTEGSVHVTNFVSIVDTNKIPKNREWLDERNNVVLLCLTADAVEQFQNILLEKEFADQNGQLHSKVFSITFGESISSLWPPKGFKRGSTDLRDFHFGFSEVDKLRPEDFELFTKTELSYCGHKIDKLNYYFLGTRASSSLSVTWVEILSLADCLYDSTCIKG